jgi:putative FmdB family regulatory protein
MPIYEYLCDACGHEYEHFAKSMSDADPLQCPQCKGKDLRKKLSLFASAPGGSQSVRPSQGGCGRCGDSNGPCS